MNPLNNNVTIKDYFETKFEAQEKALQLAREQMEYRLNGMNAFREQINKIEGTLVTRIELEAKLEAIEKGKRDNIALILSLIGIGIAIFSMFTK